MFQSLAVFADELYPLKVGNYWKYEVKGKSTYFVTNKVVDKKVIGHKTWYKYIEYGEIYWIRNGKGGQYEAMDWLDNANPKTKPKHEVLFFKYPLKSTIQYKVPSNTIQALLPLKSIKTPAGEYRCILYKMITKGKVLAENCIAPGVGVVWSKAIFDGEVEVSRLVEYGVK